MFALYQAVFSLVLVKSSIAWKSQFWIGGQIRRRTEKKKKLHRQTGQNSDGLTERSELRHVEKCSIGRQTNRRTE